MGQQQLLIILIGVIIAGLMTAAGFAMFTDGAAASNRDALANDLNIYASQAQSFQRKPSLVGGGNGSLVGYKIPGSPKNLNGSFSILAANRNVMLIQAVGVETGYDEVNPVKLTMRVTRDSLQVTEVN